MKHWPRSVSIKNSPKFREEYNTLFDFVQNKNLRIRNANRQADKPKHTEDKFADSDDEDVDHYKEGLQRDAAEREADSSEEDGSFLYDSIIFLIF